MQAMKKVSACSKFAVKEKFQDCYLNIKHKKP
jgi:hypothetical protein